MNDHIQIAKVCMLAGKIMLESGAETYRVEDTMNRLAASYDFHHVHSYATPTGINFSVDFGGTTNFMRVSMSSTDLHKIAEVNRISRDVAAGKLGISEALSSLQTIEKAQLSFPHWIQVIAASLVSGCFTIMFGGIWPDFLPALITGGIGFTVMLLVSHFVATRFIAEFFASFMIGVFTIVFIFTGYGTEMDKIIIGSVMPLVPGVPITNAVRDLLAGHLVAGVSKGVEALLTAFAIGAGIALILAFL